MAEEIKVELELGRETKNKRRYEEIGYEDILGTIYVSKRSMAENNSVFG